MRSDLQKKRDELALQKCQEIEPSITRDMVSRGHARVCANEGFKAGFDSAVELMSEREKKLVEALKQCRRTFEQQNFDTETGLVFEALQVLKELGIE